MINIGIDTLTARASMVATGVQTRVLVVNRSTQTEVQMESVGCQTGSTEKGKNKKEKHDERKEKRKREKDDEKRKKGKKDGDDEFYVEEKRDRKEYREWRRKEE